MKTKSIKYILAAGLVCCGLNTFTSCWFVDLLLILRRGH